MGGFKLGSHRKARGHQPPQPDEVPGSGPAPAAGAGGRQAPDFGSMANPLAQGARKASRNDVWAAAGAAETASFSRPGRAERPHWNPSGQAPALGDGSAQARTPTARWQPPAAPVHAESNGHLESRIQPARRPEAPARKIRQAPAPSAAQPNTAAEPSFQPQEHRNGHGNGAAAKAALDEWAPEPEGQQAAVDAVDDEEYGEEDVPRILALDRVGEFATGIARATLDLDPAPEILRLSRSTQVMEVVEQEEPDVIVVAPEEMTAAGLKRLAQVHRMDPSIAIVLSEPASGKRITNAQIEACGADEMIASGISKARLRSAMAAALETADGLRGDYEEIEDRVEVIEAPAVPRPAFETLTSYSPPHAPEPLPTPVSQVARDTKSARVFTVASASGGCGKTFYSTNFAAYLAKATGGKVLLVDLDLQFGEVAISLHLRPKRTIAELVLEENIPAALSDYLVDHSAGYKVLCAPRDPVAGDRVGPRETTMVLEAARAEFDYIVVDTPPSINETCLAAFDQSQSLVIMATMDLPSLKNLRVFLETLKKLNLPADQVSLIVNKAESGTGLDLREVEPLYPQGFSSVLPYAKQVSWSINMGMPVLVADPNADISRKLAEGAIKLVPPVRGSQIPWSAPAAAPRRGWFSRLLKGKAK